MKIRLAERTKTLSSSIRTITEQLALINQARAQLSLEPIIDLSIGQPHLAANPVALTAIYQQLTASNSAHDLGYSPVIGRDATLQAIVNLYQVYYPHVHYTLKEVMCSHGANQALWNAFSIFIQNNQGQPDIVLALEPYFGQYQAQVTALGGQFIGIASDVNDFQTTLDHLQRALTKHPATKILILNYPNNPSGQALEHKELLALVQVLTKFPALILILDDVYRDIHFTTQLSPLDVDPLLKSRTIVINSGSKGLIGAPDLRIGVVAAPEAWIAAMAQQQMLTTAGVSYLSQVAFIAAVNAKRHLPENAWHQAAITAYHSCITYACNNLNNTGLSITKKPNGGFYLLVDAGSFLGYEIPSDITVMNSENQNVVLTQVPAKIGALHLTTDKEIANYLLHVAGVAMVPGSSFGLSPFKGLLRLSCAADKSQLGLALQRIREAYVALKAMPRIALSIPIKTSAPTVKNLALIGVGNVGEWTVYLLLQAMLSRQLTEIGHIYCLGRHSKKLAAKVADQLHAMLIQQSFLSTEQRHTLLDKIHASDDYTLLKNTELVITAFGAPMTPAICERVDLLLANDLMAREVGKKLQQFASKNTLVINIANPVDIITWRLQQVSQLPPHQVIGVSGVLDVARLAQAIHEVTAIDYAHIDLTTLCVCGEHGPAMVPLLSHARVNAKPLLEQLTPAQITEILNRTRAIGTQMMEGLGKIPPHIGTAQACVLMLRAILTASPKVLPCSIWNEDYQVCMGSMVSFGPDGMHVNKFTANAMEQAALKIAADKIRADWLFVNTAPVPNADLDSIALMTTTTCTFFSQKNAPPALSLALTNALPSRL